MCGNQCDKPSGRSTSNTHGPLTRYVKFGVAHAPGMLGTFSLSPTSKETVRDTRAVMHVGIANPRWRDLTFRAFPAHTQSTILRIWQEAPGMFVFVMETFKDSGIQRIQRILFKKIHSVIYIVNKVV